MKFNNINIINAKNDCIDFSFGNYFIKKADLKNCGDKGISVGEKSRLSLLEGNITRSSLGLAAKDDAVVNIISNISIHVKKDKQCFAEYRKKQEFDHGTIINKNKINCFD